MDVELRYLRAMVAVVDHGSFTAAGAALGLSQASVSRSIASLERAVGIPVLHRTTRQLSLTDTGARILGHARRAVEEADAVLRAADAPPDEVRIGYAWGALGLHTTRAQQRWRVDHPGSELRFVQATSLAAGLVEGTADLAVLRRPLDDPRFTTVLVGVERRYAALASDDPLARRRSVALTDFADRTIAVDTQTGTTSPDLWPAGSGPARTRHVHGVDEWLTLIAAGQAVGITAEATPQQNPRPGVSYRRLRDAQPVPVFLAWWADRVPVDAAAVTQLVCELYAGGEVPGQSVSADQL